MIPAQVSNLTRKIIVHEPRVLQEPGTQDDPQYMFLRERLKALRDGWQELNQMWENRQQLLSQSLNLQMFNRDARQAEVLLSQQEHVLSKDETPVGNFPYARRTDDLPEVNKKFCAFFFRPTLNRPKT